MRGGKLFTLRDWRSNPTLAYALAETLKKEHVQLALEVLLSLGMPRELGAPPPNIPFSEWQASLNSRREGYFDCYEKLLALAVPVDPSKLTIDANKAAGTRQAWGHYAEAPEEESQSKKTEEESK